MRLHDLGTAALAGELGYKSGEESATIDEWEIKYLRGHDLVDVWYWYTPGHYEGSGALLALDSQGRYYVHEMGHCSCNGPTDGFDTRDPFESLDEIERRCSPHMLKDFRVLIEAARASLDNAPALGGNRA